MDTSADIAAIADAFTSHWRLFGLYPGAELNEEDGVLWYHSPIRHIPYNAVIRTRIDPSGDVGGVVHRVCERFRRMELPFMWAVLPSDRPGDYETHLAAAGLGKVEDATGMSLDLRSWQQPPPKSEAVIVPADSEPEISDYELLIRTYWSVPEADRPMIPVLNRHWTGERSQGTRLVAYLDGVPVGKLFLNLASVPTAAVYGVAVIPEARGKGIAHDLMVDAMAFSRSAGATRMVLHASEMGLPLYEKLGFTARCSMPIHATDPIYGGTHHH